MNHPLRILLLGSRPVGAPGAFADLLEQMRRGLPSLDVSVASDAAGVERSIAERRPDLILSDSAAADGATHLARAALTLLLHAEDARGALTESEERCLSVGRIAGGVAHDINNLLTAIFGYASLAKSDLPEGHPALKSLEMVERAAAQANVATRVLLSSGLRSPPEKRVIDIRGPVAEAASILRRELPASAEAMKGHEAPPLWVEADGAQIVQATLSLGLMARDSVPAESCPRLSIRAEGRAGGLAVITVSAGANGADDGADIPGPLRSPSQDIVGDVAAMPGISAVRRIAEEHGGRLEITRAAGSEVTFQLVLPTLLSGPAAMEPATASLHDGEGVVILLAESHGYLRDIAAYALRSAGYEVISATDGPGVLDLFARNKARVNLLILERELTSRTGLECLRLIRAAGCNAPAIIIAGAGPRQDAPGAPRVVWLRKPFQTSELLGLVRSLLNEACELPKT